MQSRRKKNEFEIFVKQKPTLLEAYKAQRRQTISQLRASIKKAARDICPALKMMYIGDKMQPTKLKPNLQLLQRKHWVNFCRGLGIVKMKRIMESHRISPSS